jgi:hypothetical protein
LSILLTGCAANKNTYEWGSYSSSLLDYYKNPSELNTYVEKLGKSIQKAEIAGPGKVPPGLYAEYGYAKLKQGDQQQALLYFAKESEHWPESAYLMNKVSQRLSRPAAPTQAATPKNHANLSSKP